MRLKLVSGAAVLAAAAVLLPGSALSVAQIQEQSDGLADFDSRTGQIAPTKHQRAAARKLRANVTWGQFGTPSTITRRGKFLAKNIKTKTPAGAARAWLRLIAGSSASAR